MKYSKCAMGGMAGTSKKIKLKVGDAVMYKRFTGIPTHGIVLQIDKDRKYAHIRNNVGNIEYIETSKITL